MAKFDHDAARWQTFLRQAEVARRSALGGYLTPTDLKGLEKRGATLGLEQHEIAAIIALSAETWRQAPVASKSGYEGVDLQLGKGKRRSAQHSRQAR